MNQAAIMPPAIWDRHAIKAEVHRQGKTLTGIARAAGLTENACRQALFGLNRRGAEAIADALGIPFDTLFPTGFLQSRSSEGEASPKVERESRQKGAVSPDAGASN